VFGLRTRSGSVRDIIEGSAGFSFLLDTYPDAAVAYSLRKISSTYAGNAIRVRRSSDNTEQNIGFSGIELDTSSLVSFCAGTNGFVTFWYDQSGNNRNASQGVATDQPQIVSAGSILLLNNKPSIFTDGITDFLITSSNFQYNNATMVFVAAQASGEGGSYGRFIDNVFTSGFWFGRDAGNAALSGGFVQPSSPFGAAISYPDNTQFLMFSTRNDSLTTNIVNSTLSNSRSTTAGLTPLNPIRIGRSDGGSSPGKKYHQEYILYYTNQSSNRTGIESNINSYYNIY
jgi:hypothetical protein